LPYNVNNISAYRRKKMKRKINKIREKLYKEMQSKEMAHENIIEISEELDQLIIKYYKEETESQE
jgi:hypothetical protein